MMNIERARIFLDQHQPMPSDDDLDEQTIAEFDEIRKLLIRHPNEELLLRFMTAFGDGTGFGVYQLADDALRAHASEVAVRAILNGMRSDLPSAVKWCIHFSAEFPSQDYRSFLHRGLASDDSDVRVWSAMGLSAIYDSASDDSLIKSRMKIENDPEVLDILNGLE